MVEKMSPQGGLLIIFVPGLEGLGGIEKDCERLGRIGRDLEELRKIGRDWEGLGRIEKDWERLGKIEKDWERSRTIEKDWERLGRGWRWFSIGEGESWEGEMQSGNKATARPAFTTFQWSMVNGWWTDTDILWNLLERFWWWWFQTFKTKC